MVFRPACKMGLEGGLSRNSGDRVTDQDACRIGWNSRICNAPAVKREPEEDWGPVMCREREL